MRTLDKKLCRDMLQSKGMLLAIIAVIAVGTACFSGMLGTFYNLDDARISYYSRCRMADFWVNLKKVPDSVVSRLNNISGISEVRGRIVFPVIVDLANVDRPLSGEVVSMPDTPEPVVNNFVLKCGSYFSRNRDDEVIVSEKFAKARRILPGTYVHLVMNGQRKKLYVVGIAICSEYIYLTPPGSIVPDNDGYGVFWIKHRYAENMFGFHGASNSVIGLLTPRATRDPGLVMDKLRRELERYGVFNVTPLSEQYSNLSLNSEMSGLKMQATIMPIIFMGVAAMILNVVMLRMAEQQRVVIGTFKALGFDNRAVMMHFLKFALIVGLIGGIAGCGLGYLIASGMIVMYKGFFSFPHLVNHPYAGLMLLGVFISVAFSVLGSFRGARKVIRLNPAEAMRPSPPAVSGRILLEHWTWFWSRMNFQHQMILRGIFRNKGRSIIGVCAAMFGGAILFLAMGMSDSFAYMLEFEYDKVLRSDFILNLRDEAGYGAVFEAARLPGISKAEAKLDVACHLINGSHSKKIAITGIMPNSRLTVPCNSAGNPVPVPETGVLINRRLADELQVSTGEKLRMVPVKGRRIAHNIPVAGIVESTFGLVAYADFYYLNKLIGQTATVTSVMMNGYPSQSERTAMFRLAKRFPKLSSLEDVNVMKKMMSKEFIDSMSFFSGVLILFAGIIFFGSILNASLISISEREREIATFRVLGYQPGEVGQIFLRENLIINLTGAVLGIPLGYLMLKGMADQYQNDMFSMPCAVAFTTWFLTPLLALGFIIAAHLVIAKVIKKLNWSDALKMRE